jgi:hypothetical protein
MKSKKQTTKAPEEKLKSFVEDVKEELKEKKEGLMSKGDK